MSEANSTLTQERLKELLSYDPTTGDFVWIKQLSGMAKLGSVAGTNNGAGYIQIRIGGKKYFAHRLAFFFVNGYWPANVIDHINGNRSDNRIANLRDVPKSMNQQNMVAPRKNTKSGLLGVCWNGPNNVWEAKIKYNGRKVHIGSFKTPEEAHAAYLKIKRNVHAGCTI